MNENIQKARDIKARQIRLCRKYLYYARRVLKLSEEAPTIKHYSESLRDWRNASIGHIIARFIEKEG